MKTRKKGLHQKLNTFPLPNSSGHLRSDAHQRQIIGGDADVDHTQTIGGRYSQIIWGIHPPRVSAPLVVRRIATSGWKSLNRKLAKLNFRFHRSKAKLAAGIWQLSKSLWEDTTAVQDICF